MTHPNKNISEQSQKNTFLNDSSTKMQLNILQKPMSFLSKNLIHIISHQPPTRLHKVFVHIPEEPKEFNGLVNVSFESTIPKYTHSTKFEQLPSHSSTVCPNSSNYENQYACSWYV